MADITEATNTPESASQEATTDPKGESQTAAPADTSTPAPADAASAEAAKASPPPEARPEEDPRFARAFGALSRKEKLIRERETALKAQEQQLSQLAKLAETAKNDPLAALQALGLDYEALTEAVLKNGQPPTADDRVAQLEKRLQEREEAERKAREEQSTREQAAQIEQGKSVVRSTIEQAGEKFELVCAEGAFDDVWDVIVEYHKAHGEVMAVEEAAEHVERELEARAERILKAKKIAAKLAPAAAPPKSDSQSPRANGATTTLTNSSVADAPINGEMVLPLDPEERNRALLSSSKFRLWDDAS